MVVVVVVVVVVSAATAAASSGRVGSMLWKTLSYLRGSCLYGSIARLSL